MRARRRWVIARTEVVGFILWLCREGRELEVWFGFGWQKRLLVTAEERLRFCIVGLDWALFGYCFCRLM